MPHNPSSGSIASDAGAGNCPHALASDVLTSSTPWVKPTTPGTLLDPEETTAHRAVSEKTAALARESAALNRSFRHSWWRDRRGAVSAALLRLNADQARTERFEQCGSTAWVMRAKDDSGRYRIAGNRCKDRWCEACSAEKRRTLLRNLTTKLPVGRIRLLTLTLKSSEIGLKSQIDRIYNCFKDLRRRKEFRKRLRGGLFFLEISLNETTKKWHPHLHVLCQGEFLPIKLVRETWHEITGDSYICDVREIKDAQHAVRYVAKYASKAISHNVFHDPEKLDEAIDALHGRRTFNVFGNWTKLGLSKVPDDDCGWEVFDSLANVIRRARAGDSECRKIVFKLKNGGDFEEVDLDNSDTS